jgi:hypothetical protein
VDFVSLRAGPSAGAVAIGVLYNGFHAAGVQYGPGYRTLVKVWCSIKEAIGQLRARSTNEGTSVHPADLDDAFCIGALASSRNGSGETQLPFAVDDASLRGGAGMLWAVRCG